MSKPPDLERDRDVDYMLRVIRRTIDRHWPDSSDPVLMWQQAGQDDLCRLDVTGQFAEFPRNDPTKVVASRDWRKMTWYGQTYDLTETQGRILKILYHARNDDNPYINQRIVLEQAGSQSMKMWHAFRTDKGQIVYQKLLEGDGKGGYRFRDRPKQDNEPTE